MGNGDVEMGKATQSFARQHAQHCPSHSGLPVIVPLPVGMGYGPGERGWHEEGIEGRGGGLHSSSQKSRGGCTCGLAKQTHRLPYTAAVQRMYVVLADPPGKEKIVLLGTLPENWLHGPFEVRSPSHDVCSGTLTASLEESLLFRLGKFKNLVADHICWLRVVMCDIVMTNTTAPTSVKHHDGPGHPNT